VERNCKAGQNPQRVVAPIEEERRRRRLVLVYTVANVWQFEHKNSKRSSRLAFDESAMSQHPGSHFLISRVLCKDGNNNYEQLVH